MCPSARTHRAPSKDPEERTPMYTWYYSWYYNPCNGYYSYYYNWYFWY
jgi:hypothetical protein